MDNLKTEKDIEIQNNEHPIPREHSFSPESKINVGLSQPNSLHATSWYSGPIPPPDYLAAYEKIVPGIAKQFLEEPHREAEHRRILQTKMVDGQLKLGNKGQNFAFILASLAIIGSIGLIYLGHDIGGFASLLLSIAAFVGVFIYGRHKSERS